MNIMCPNDMHVVKDIYGGFKKVYIFMRKCICAGKDSTYPSCLNFR